MPLHITLSATRGETIYIGDDIAIHVKKKPGTGTHQVVVKAPTDIKIWHERDEAQGEDDGKTFNR